METVLFLTASQFVLILARLLAMLMIAPMFSGKIVPIRFRAVLVVLLAVLMSLHQKTTVSCFVNTASWLDEGFLCALLCELLLGLLLGAAALLFFGALRTTGTIIAYVGGISFPMDGGLTNDAAPITASFFYLLGTAVVFLCGGHLLLIEAILRTFATYPVGMVPSLAELVKSLPDVFILGFQVSVQMALPIIAVVLLAQLGLAILNRVMPQLDVFGLAFPVNVLALLFMLSLTIGGALMLFETEYEKVIQNFLR